MKTDQNNDKLTDNALRALLKERLPRPAADPWFTRRVLNRLPERRRRLAAGIEIWVCAIAALVVLVLAVRYEAGLMSAPLVTVGDLLKSLLYAGLFGALVLNSALPFMRGLSGVHPNE